MGELADSDMERWRNEITRPLVGILDEAEIGMLSSMKNLMNSATAVSAQLDLDPRNSQELVASLRAELRVCASASAFQMTSRSRKTKKVADQCTQTEADNETMQLEKQVVKWSAKSHQSQQSLKEVKNTLHDLVIEINAIEMEIQCQLEAVEADELQKMSEADRVVQAVNEAQRAAKEEEAELSARQKLLAEEQSGFEQHMENWLAEMELRDKQLEAKVKMIQDQHVQLLVCKQRGQLLEQKQQQQLASAKDEKGVTSWNAMYSMMKHEATQLKDSNRVLDAETLELTESLRTGGNKVRDQALKFDRMLLAQKQEHITMKASIGSELKQIQAQIKALVIEKEAANAERLESKHSTATLEEEVPTMQLLLDLRNRVSCLEYALRASTAKKKDCDKAIQHLQDKSQKAQKLLEKPGLLLPKMKHQPEPHSLYNGIEVAAPMMQARCKRLGKIWRDAVV